MLFPTYRSHMDVSELLAATEALEWRNAIDQAIDKYKQNQDKFAELYEKRSYSPFADRLGQAMNLWKGQYFAGIPNHPSPLASMLVTGLAGLGVGYGAGTLAEKILPASWHRNRLRTAMALAGGALGTVPGAMWGGINRSSGRPFNSNELFQERVIEPPKPFSSPDLDFILKSPRLNPQIEAKASAMLKASDYQTGIMNQPVIDVERFEWDVWNDPRVSELLTMPQQAAASGLMSAAANLPGKKNVRLISPIDVGRMAAGMGSGYLAGALVGKALGVMMGMPEETQNRLKNTGMWAGTIANLLPIVFGG